MKVILFTLFNHTKVKMMHGHACSYTRMLLFFSSNITCTISDISKALPVFMGAHSHHPVLYPPAPYIKLFFPWASRSTHAVRLFLLLGFFLQVYGKKTAGMKYSSRTLIWEEKFKVTERVCASHLDMFMKATAWFFLYWGGIGGTLSGFVFMCLLPPSSPSSSCDAGGQMLRWWTTELPLAKSGRPSTAKKKKAKSEQISKFWTEIWPQKLPWKNSGGFFFFLLLGTAGNTVVL